LTHAWLDRDAVEPPGSILSSPKLFQLFASGPQKVLEFYTKPIEKRRIPRRSIGKTIAYQRRQHDVALPKQIRDPIMSQPRR